MITEQTISRGAPAFADGLRFVGVPGVFQHHYTPELREWVQHFEKWGPRFTIWLRRDPSGVPVLLGDGADSLPGVPIIGAIVNLRATPVRAFRKTLLVIQPADPVSAKRILDHSQDLTSFYESGDPHDWSGLEGKLL